MYTGNIVTSDPALIEAREIGKYMHAYVLVDQDALNPRDTEYNSPFGHMVSFSDRTIQPDNDSDLARQVIGAAAHFGREWRELLPRYLRMFHDADVVEWGQDSEGSIIGFATADQVAAENMTTEQCAELMCAELKGYREWANGEVFGVIVNDERTSNEASVWGVYDDCINDTIRELVLEVERANGK